MQILNNRILAGVERVLGCILIPAMVIISVLVYKADVTDLLIFLMFVLLYVQLPGFLIVKLTNIRTGHISAQLLISFFAGWTLVVAEYFITELIKTDILLYALGPAMSLALIILFFKKKTPTTLKIKVGTLPLGTIVFVVLVMLYVLMFTQYIFLAPDATDVIYASKDKLYQMGLINGLSQGYPLENPWIDGRIVYYHLFSQLLYSIPVRLFGLDSWFIMMSCAPYVTTYLLTLSFYTMFRYFSRIKQRAGIYSLTVFLSHMFIARSITSSYTFRVLFVNDNFAAFGAAAAIAWVILIDVFIKNMNTEPRNSYSKKTLFLNAGLMMGIMALMTGIKAPMALVMVGAAIGTQLLAMIMKRSNYRMSLLIIAVGLSFYFIYTNIVSSKFSTGTSAGSIFAFGKITNILFWKKPLIEFLTGIGIPSIARLLVILLLFAIFFFTVYTIPAAIGYIRELYLVISRKKEFDFARVNIYAAFLVGLVLLMFLSYSGHSEIYFGLISTVFAPLIAFWFFEDIELDSEKRYMKRLSSGLKVLFIFMLCLTTLSLAAGMKLQFKIAVAQANSEIRHNPYNSVTENEYKGLEWIKENTPEDALLATQKHSSVAPDNYSYEDRWVNGHFHYAAYSEREYYIEGAGFSLSDEEWTVRRDMVERSDRLFDVNNTKRGDEARSLGIDYVVRSEKVGKAPSLENKDYKLRYSNPEIEVYQVIY